MKAQDLLKGVRAHVEALGHEIDAAKASAEYQAWLDCCARFHKYSLHNSLLILMQCPNASRVAGYRAWQKMDRQVRKGERSIRILAPCVCRKTSDDEMDGSGEPKTRTVTYFKVVSVFDVSQTEGEALPTLDTMAHGDDQGLLNALIAVASDRGVGVSFKEFSGECHGKSFGGRVEVDSRLEPAGRVKTLIHELAHEALHKDRDGIPSSEQRAQREHEAEAVAYVVCTHFGIDGGSAKYLATWGADSTKLIERLENIHKASSGLITDMEASMSEKVESGHSQAA